MLSNKESMRNEAGYTATRAIRSCGKENALSVPILATTANAFAEDYQKCLDCGMSDHIVKPIKIGALLPQIRHHCKKERHIT